MPYDLTKATLQRSGTGHDLTKAAQTPKGAGRSTASLTTTRQPAAASRAHDVAKPTKGASATGKAMPARAKKG